MSKIEEVKKKLDQHYRESPDGMGNLYIAKLICQVFEPFSNANTTGATHSKPDRLLTDS